MSASQASPSPFAALLRRSKLASYDRSIGQVYTTYGGHAHRGNWGLKRPLPNRRRLGFITVRGVDSPEQQTEWNSAEASARWMRRWDELGKKLEVEDAGSWASRKPFSWTIDSEFDRAGKVGLEPGRERAREQNFSDSRNLIPDFDAMTPRQFEKYITRLRTLRPEFKSFLEEYRKQEGAKSKHFQMLNSEQQSTYLKIDASGQVDMYASAQGQMEAHVDRFLEHLTKRDLSSLESRRIEPRPHTFAGLEYALMSALQANYLHKPAPGRDIAQSRAERYVFATKMEKIDLIAVGGIVGMIPSNGLKNVVPTDFGSQTQPRRHRDQGKGVFRMSNVRLVDAPVTVGHKPQGPDRATFDNITFSAPELLDANHSNPHPLGSMDYVNCISIIRGRHAAPLVPASIMRKVHHVRERHRPRNVNSPPLHKFIESLKEKMTEQPPAET